jgi:anti-sigma factor RsiW
MYGAVAATLAAFVCGTGTGWLVHGVTATPSAIESLTSDALDAHRLYVVEVRHPVEVPGNERDHLQTWLTKRCGWEVRAPKLDANGLKLVGGRLLPGPTGPASFFMYESASGERYTLYASRSKTGSAQMRYTAAENSGAMYWSEDEVSYVLSGPIDKEKLHQVARLVYDQTDRGG